MAASPVPAAADESAASAADAGRPESAAASSMGTMDVEARGVLRCRQEAFRWWQEASPQRMDEPPAPAVRFLSDEVSRARAEWALPVPKKCPAPSVLRFSNGCSAAPCVQVH